MADSENDASRTWFFEQLRKAFGIRENMCIVSDRHDSITTAIKNVYPEAAHMHCIFHILNNLKTRFKKNTAQIKEYFYGAAKCYTLQEFESNISEIKKLDIRVHKYLEDIGYDKWTKLHSTNKRYRIMTTKIAESMNVAIKSVRELQITTLLEYLRALVQEWNANNQMIAKATFTKLSKKAEDILNDNYLKSHKIKVKNSNTFSVCFRYDTSNILEIFNIFFYIL